ncbi:MAG: aldose 1-epimerase family protein [Planctomycetes bacterium]|nr:aldose 1-epimerase family protein [Planctomycetota bacterium]
MPILFGKNYSKEDLEKRTGHLSQLACIRAAELADGNEKGVRTLDFRTGSGFAFSVLPDRCMDISFAEYRGAPLCWRSAVGDAHPAFYEAEGLQWLRTFQGGMLATCGLMNTGPASVDQGEPFGVHGRIGTAPARNVQWDAEWKGSRYVLWAQGRMREGRLFGENVTLTRRMTTALGSNRLTIEDVIENHNFTPTPMMVLYHFNCGFPVLDETSEVLIQSEVIPRDEPAIQGLPEWNQGGPPTHAFREQVHQHRVKPGASGTALAALVNRAFDGGRGLGVAIRFRPDELGYLWQWRQIGEGAYVMGLEPSNAHVMGRGEERRQGRLPILEPGGRRVHHLEFEVLTCQEDIDRIQEESQARERKKGKRRPHEDSR